MRSVLQLKSKTQIAFRLLSRLYGSDYGMLFVLLLLVVAFSLLTLTEQHPTGDAAGLEVAKRIASTQPNANVLIVARDTGEDRAFSEAANAKLQELGANVLDVVHGQAPDARKSMEAILENSQQIDAVATVQAVAKWTVFDKVEGVGSSKCVTPQPHTWPNFLKLSNVLNIASQTAIYAIIAIGMTMVIITAGIDLGVGSLVALAAVTSAVVIRDWGGGTEASVDMIVVGTLAGVVICALAGALCGIAITWFELPPFIMTLGSMLIARGLARRFAEDESVPELPDGFFWLGAEQTFGVPNPVWLMIVLYAIAHIVMTRTVFGRYVYAVGGNLEAARLSGVPVRRIVLSVYTICGALSGLGGVVLASQLRTGDPKFGEMYELDVIAAVVVGGTSLMGGSGKILGTLIGAFIITIIRNGMNLMNVAAFNQGIVLGSVLLGAVLLDQLKRR